MASEAKPQKEIAGALPADNTQRELAVTRTQDGRHIGVVGDTYTILVSGADTAGRFCLIDMFVPPGGGPPPHRHDFEETFSLVEGELELTFRGGKSTVHAGETVNIPANAPHHSTILRIIQRACFASAHPPDKRTSSSKSEHPSRAAPLRRRSWTKPVKPNSGKRLKPSLQNTGPNCCHTRN
jgi:quercetin dioxygenase-like cupin family protein